jgi:hypothetical protein
VKVKNENWKEREGMRGRARVECTPVDLSNEYK